MLFRSPTIKGSRGRPRKNYETFVEVKDPSMKCNMINENSQELLESENPEDKIFENLNILELDKNKPLPEVENFLDIIPTERIKEFGWLKKRTDSIRKIKNIKEITCLDIFTEYINEMRRKVVEGFFYILIVFVNAYREAADAYCWNKVEKSKQLTLEDKKRSFCECNSGETLPEIANDFIVYFLPIEYRNFDRELAIDLTKHLCSWLKRKKYTQSYILPNTNYSSN